MEYMRIEGFLGNAISKMINKGVESKFGYKPGVALKNLNLKTDINPDTHEEIVLVDLSVYMTQNDFNKLIEEATK